MTIATYADLKTAAANWLLRSDLPSRIPEFITLAESRINYGSMEAPFQSDPLRIRAMETSADLTISAQAVALPTRYLQAKRIYLNTNPVSYVVPTDEQTFWSSYLGASTGRPRAFIAEGEYFKFGPSPDATYTGKLLYYQGFAALSGDSDTNWLLTNAANAYLAGTLLEAFKFMRNTEQAAIWLNSFTGTINALMASDKQDRYASPWIARSDTGSP